MPPADPPPKTITLRLKVPPGHLPAGNDEFPLGAIDTDTTLGALRDHIQRHVPTHPPPASQRLLYAGRALVDNAQPLADALNTRRDTTQTEYVLHLLVKDPAQNTAPGVAPSHRRNVSTPAAPLPPSRTATPPPPPPPHRTAPEHNLMHQQEIQRQMQATQHMAMQAMAQAQRIMVPPMAGNLIQHTLAGGAMPPPGVNMPGFAHAVAPGQQQRALAGMHGVGGQADGAGPQGAESQNRSDTALTTAQDQAGNTQQQPPQAPAVDANGQYITFPDGRRAQVSSGSGINIPQLGINIPITHLIPQINQLLQQRANAAAAAGGMLPQTPPPPPAQQQAAAPASQPPPMPPQTAMPTSALDRARDNVAEMRRMLDEMRNATATTDEQRSRIERLQERTRSLNDYIDPMHLHGVQRPATQPPQAAPPIPAQPSQAVPPLPAQPPQAVPPIPAQRMPMASPLGPVAAQMAFGGPPGMHPGMPPMPPFTNPVRATYTQQMIHAMPVARPQPSSTPSDATCFLLSGPQGPQALLLSPRHGTYTSTFARSTPATPTPTVPQQAITQPGQQPPIPDPAAPPLAPNGNAPPAQQPLPAAFNPDAPMGALQPLFNHFWLLFRVLIFAYFFLGSNMGWRRPAALLLIGLGFWLVRAGLFGEWGVARRWWDGIMHPNGVPPPAGEQQQQQQQHAQAQQPQGPQGQGGRQAMPTPEQVAQRLLDERNRVRDERMRRLRDLVRPVERVVALFLASLWPGVGEAAVRAREEEERRRNEEEVARRRREEEEEEERVKNEEEQKAKLEGQDEGAGEKGAVDGVEKGHAVGDSPAKVGEREEEVAESAEASGAA